MTNPTSAHPESSGLPPTEQRNPRSENLDDLDTRGVLQLLTTESQAAVDAVNAALDELTEAVDVAAERMRRGGTVHYFGAGTSGRLGVLDASELKPTFNLEPGRVVAHIAGGPAAVTEAVENAEDSMEEGRHASEELGENDVAVGIAASGSTPYVGGALENARKNGAYTVLISNNPGAPLAANADIHVALSTGPEVVTGSTRLKAGTAQKLVLNGFSTALMIALGRTWNNLMVSVVATNEKLRARTLRILGEAVDLDEPEARELLEESGGDLKTAIVSALAEVSAEEASSLLTGNAQSVRDAIASASATQKRSPQE
ncbi:MAG TPA: N-acetylmuramic acid 6-phosphate etherase [Candidatus Corynebacterium avicola]|uniref:N-acetylmuramic acid 6-phosphate etherase n=1 Tax=Candidatus Corynebacterium avicola TaxID=2838527 RepID=A0A9D1RQU6_9CORY|nr:N-acetylmuramic acid 6-phosphate etherase [Candidatus Corynebacterium avicola]